MQLVDNPRAVWKRYSAIALAASTSIFGLLAVWEKLPQSVLDAVPPTYLAVAGTVTGVLGLIGSFLKQVSQIPNPFADTSIETLESDDAHGG